MNLKDLFDNAENGTLTFSQLEAAASAAGAKFVDLSEGNYVSLQKHNDAINARDTQINTLNTTIKTRDEDLAKLQNQLNTAGTDAQRLSQLSTDFATLQTKYDNDTKAYKAQLQEQAYKYAVNDFASKYKFTSGAAKRDFVSAMLGKNLTIDGETIVGASDFVESYRKDNSDAFVVETPESSDGNVPQPKPHFTSATTPTSGDSAEVDPFNFNFMGVRSHDTK